MKLYSTVFSQARAEQEIERSKFITTVRPVDTREEAEEFFGEIRREFKDATHNVPAMVIGDKMQIQWASDDGEPQGTSGAPIVQMLVKEGITNVALVVTRYFGGIKLGTGGLVRAYTGSARLGIEAAGICDVTEMSVVRFRVEYPVFSRIQSVSLPGEASISGEEYTDKVAFDVTCLPEYKDAVKKAVSEYSSGSAEVLSEAADFVRAKRP